tara:strand:+ start:1507 stop:3084 length:1578 start_codon:yes stop_codon:yes gene_type:complete
MEKEYAVVVKKGINISDVDAEMSAAAGDASIPNRPCECAKELIHNSRYTHWMLTDEEAISLRNDDRILDVHIPFEHDDNVMIEPTARQGGTYDKTGGFPASGINWGLSRCSSATNNFPSGTNEVTDEYLYALDGTGIDVVIMDSGIQADHPEWEDANGVSRLKQIDWYAESGGTISGTMGAQHYTDQGGHGTFCAGIAAGKTYGWAKNADIYVIKIFDTDEIATGTAIDLVTAWHNNKGTGRPTVINMSFGYINGGLYDNDGPGAIAGDTGTYYSDNTNSIVSWTYGDAGYDTATAISYKTNWSHDKKTVQRLSSIDASIDLMVDAGVHVVVAAGNYSDVQSEIGDVHYNDSLTRNGVIHYYHRGSSPRTTDDGNDIVVGSMSNALLSNLDSAAEYSSRGPGVDIWAPGTNITSCTTSAGTATFLLTDYVYDNNFKISNSDGTSFSAPQIAGIIAMYLQLYPTLTPAQMKAKILDDSKDELLFDVTVSEYNNASRYQYISSGGLFGTPNKIMFNPFVGDALVKWQ